jgi:catalase
LRTAYEAHAEDNDLLQAGWLVRNVLDDDARCRLADNAVAQLVNGVSEGVLQRAFNYLRKVDHRLGDAVEKGARDGASRSD